jgi:hypothetical protein
MISYVGSRLDSHHHLAAMTKTSNDDEPLRLALRIGITGSRQLSTDQLPRIRGQVTEFLSNVRSEVARLAQTPEARAAYGSAGQVAPEPQLLALSPLAEGSDRLLAEVALEQGFLLSCPLPFARSEYEEDFLSDESKLEFRNLLSRAEGAVLELDGARADAEDVSYEAVGRYVARNCDILVAIWDGQPSKGFGGTNDIVRFAVNHGPPVWWIHSNTDSDPIWLVERQDLRKPAKELLDRQPGLQAFLTRLMLPPAVSEPHAITWFERAARTLRRQDPPAYLTYRKLPAAAERWIWKAYDWLMNCMGGAVPEPPPLQEPSDKSANYWFNNYRPADARAAECASRYRSTYVWVFGLATIAVTFASIALVVSATVPAKLTVTGIEFIALILIAVAVLANERQRWHRLFLEHRLLAELCRKQQALAIFGWSLQGPAVTEKSLAFVSHPSSQEGNWVSWLFGVLQRSAPLPQGRFETGRTKQAREEAIRDLIDDQLTYHRARAIQSHRASERLGQLGEWFFVAVLGFVIIKLVLVALHADHYLILALGLAAAILPALSAGFVGIRSYTELPLLADQSHRMHAEMEAARIRIQQIDPAEPLASQILGSEIFSVATVMLQDIQGWFQLFRAKVVEPG